MNAQFAAEPSEFGGFQCQDDLAAINRYLDEVPEVMARFGYEYVRSKEENLREF